MLFKISIFFFLAVSFLADNCPNDKLCIACDGSRCVSCLKGFSNAEGLCVKPDVVIDKCLFYDGSLEKPACNGCEYGYYVSTKEKKCIKINIDNCLVAIDNTKVTCVVCKDGVLPVDGKCEDSSKKCPFDNCELCSSEEGQSSCFKCKKGYTLNANNGKCVEGLDGCYIRDEDSKLSCEWCHQDYYMSGDRKCSERKGALKVAVSVASLVAMLFAF